MNSNSRKIDNYHENTVMIHIPRRLQCRVHWNFEATCKVVDGSPLNRNMK